MTLTLTRYPANRHGDHEMWGIDWNDGRPAVERCYPTEVAARAACTDHFPGIKVTAVRTWLAGIDKHPA